MTQSATLRLRRLTLAAAALLLPAAALAQTGSVGIGTTAPDPAAALDVRGTDRGLLPPRLTQTQRDAVRTTGGQALGTDQAGLLVYNLTTSALNLWDGARWQEVLGTGPGGNAAQAGPAATTFNFTGSPQTYTVPAGVTQIQVVADGAGSGYTSIGNQYRPGGRVSATLAVVPGEVLTVVVGESSDSFRGGYNGGGNGGGAFGTGGVTILGMGGGGATDLRRAPALGSTGDYLASRNALLVAGGAGGSTTNPGGPGGTPNGGNGAAGTIAGGGGATQAGPGAGGSGGSGLGNGGNGSGPNGGNGVPGAFSADFSGGGGGGYYGGGAGGWAVSGINVNGSAGGGGSSRAMPGATNVSYATSPVPLNGQLTITPVASGPAPAFSTANLGGWQTVPAGLAYAAGSVGIRTNFPLLPLDVNGALLLRKRLVLAPQNGADPNTNGIWNLDNAGNDLRIFQEDNLGGANGVVRLTIRNGGNVGIGTSTPGVPLDVQATASTGVGGYAYLANINPTTGFGSIASADVSIRASGRVVAPEFNATSDRRLKNVVGLSDRAADLALLNQLRITDYTMKDRVQFGERKFKKVIAQEVEAVFPQAVNRQAGFLPDVYVRATAAVAEGDSVLHLTLPAAAVPALASARAGQRLKLIGPAGEVVGTLAAAPTPAGVAPALRLRLPQAAALANGPLFVFGLEHADVRTVDYEALGMLNVSATQELTRQLAQARAEAAGAKAEAAHASHEAAAAHAATAELLRRVQALEAQGQQARR